MAKPPDKRQARRKKREVRRAERRIAHIKSKVRWHEKELSSHRRYKTLLEIGDEFAPLLPDLAADTPSTSLGTYQKLVDARLRSVPQLTPTSVRKTGIARVREEVGILDHFLSELTFYQDFPTFVQGNKLPLWVAFCAQVFAHRRIRKEVVMDVKEARYEYETLATQLWTSLGWRKLGRSFQVTSLLTNTFSVADVPVSSDFLEPPFPFMVFALPPRFFVERKDLSLSPISDILVGYILQSNGDKTLSLISTPSHFDAKGSTTSVQFKKGSTIQQSIHRFCRETSLEQEWEQILNFICNAILYCASFPNDVVPHNDAKLKKLQERLKQQKKAGTAKSKKTGRKLHQAQNDSILIVGTKFRIDDKRVSDELSHDDGRKLRIRHIVRGHWRNQAYGPRHTERKLLFVQPHWRGVGKEGPVKTYVVK